MKRIEAINLIKFAGYHGDTRALIDLYTSNRVSYDVAQDAYREGQQCKTNGMKCGCTDCKVPA